jgi:hypothetical protein
MDNKKFEQLINLIINENEEQARALFHDIVVEKSREIYEGMMDDEMQEGMGGQVGDLLDEINAEEAGGMTEDDEADIEFDDGDEDGEEVELELGDEGEEGGLEDRVVDLEDKLDQLMAEFEDIMGGDAEEGADDFEAGEEEGMADFGAGEEEGAEEAMMEAVQMKQIGGSTYNKYGQMGDNGAQTKSPSLVNSGQAGMDSKPVKFSGASESVPTSPKAPSNAYTKGETSVKGAGSFKNAPAQNNFSEKGESTPKPVTKDEAGKVRSPVAESRNTPAKRRI